MKGVIGACALTSIVLSLAGCGNSTSPPVMALPGTQANDHQHDSWWCNEHGVPEEVCAQCNTKLVADFKAKSDWCKEHDRPDSQCFVCHPERATAFVALYEAKYGHAPPPRDDEKMN